MNYKKQIPILLCICILIPIIFICIYKYDNQNLKLVQVKVNKNISKNIKYSIEEIDNNGNLIKIKGWIISKGETNPYFNWVCGKGENPYINNSFVLIDGKNFYKMNTITSRREDITKLFNDKTNYDNSGIIGLTKTSQLISDKVYKIGILKIDINNNESIILTKNTITKKNMRYKLEKQTKLGR
jgi:hypothetical protein